MNKSSLTFPLLLCLLIGLILCSLSWGRFAIPLENVVQSLIGNNINDVQNNIIFNLRLPRVIAAMLVGASLAIAGVVYQGIFRNPLVSPDILGVSNGACVGAALAILIGSGMLGIQAFAFVGGLIAVLFTTFNSARFNHCFSAVWHYCFGLYDGNIRPIEISRRSRNPAS